MAHGASSRRSCSHAVASAFGTTKRLARFEMGRAGQKELARCGESRTDHDEKVTQRNLETAELKPQRLLRIPRRDFRRSEAAHMI